MRSTVTYVNSLQRRAEGVRLTPVAESAGLRALLVQLGEGESVAPCVMPMDVLYCVIEGRGALDAECGRFDLERGTLALVPMGMERSIRCDEGLRIVAVQAVGQED